MRIDEPSGQNRLSLWNLIIGGVLCAVVYFLGYRSMAKGILFGLLLMTLNFRVLSKILNVVFRFASYDIAKVLGFVSYHIRFWILILVMFLVIPKTDMYFGVGTFLGILIPKFSLGIALLQKKEEEWWAQDFPACEPQKPVLSGLEKELAEKDPFTVDPIELELKKYQKEIKKNKQS